MNRTTEVRQVTQKMIRATTSRLELVEARRPPGRLPRRCFESPREAHRNAGSSAARQNLDTLQKPLFQNPGKDPGMGRDTNSLAGILRLGKYSVKKKEYFL